MSPRKVGRIEVVPALGCQVGMVNGKPCGKPGHKVQIVIEISICAHHEALFMSKGPTALSMLIVEKVELRPTSPPRVLS